QDTGARRLVRRLERLEALTGAPQAGDGPLRVPRGELERAASVRARRREQRAAVRLRELLELAARLARGVEVCGREHDLGVGGQQPGPYGARRLLGQDAADRR